MDYIDDEKEEVVNTFDSNMRDIKIDIISGDLDFTFKPDINSLKKGDNLLLKKGYWPIIEKHKYHCVITGSASLKAFGLIERDPDDIDLVLMDNDTELIKSLKKDRYPGMDSNFMLGYYVYKSYSSNYLVDFFNPPLDLNIIEEDGYRFEHPLDVMYKKFNIKRRKQAISYKDYEDIKMCFKKLRQ